MSQWTWVNALFTKHAGRTEIGPVRPARRRAAQYRGLEPLELRELLSTTATHLVIGLQPTNGYVGLKNPFALTVELTDAGGNLVTSDHSAVTLTDPSGSLAKSITVHASGGIATFSSLLFTQTGTVTLTATDATDSLTVNTGQIVIQAAPAPHTITFSQAPASDPTGANPGDVQVSIKDQYGNLFSVPETVTLSLVNPSTGEKLLGKLSVKTSGGIADFPGLTVNEGGQFQIQASGAGLTVSSGALTMGGPTTATQLHFLQQPSDAVAGVANTPPITVEVLDQFNNVISTDHSRVTLTVATGPGTMKKVSVNAKNGIATFNKIILTTVGQYQLAAADGSLTGDTSHSFNITAGVATKLVFELIPTTGTPAAGPITVKVDAVDKFGNVDTTSTAAVTLATATAPHGVPPQSQTVNASAGVATFNSLAFPSAGKYSLKATATSLGSATSTSFLLV